jgi:hypothetical protein
MRADVPPSGSLWKLLRFRVLPPQPLRFQQLLLSIPFQGSGQCLVRNVEPFVLPPVLIADTRNDRSLHGARLLDAAVVLFCPLHRIGCGRDRHH